MATPKRKILSKSGIIIDRVDGDIIECAFNNDFIGVDKELEKDPRLINAQRRGTGVTPLMAAASAGLAEMAGYLSGKEGVDFHLIDAAGLDALDHARRFPEVVGRITNAMYPNSKWREPDIKLV